MKKLKLIALISAVAVAILLFVFLNSLDKSGPTSQVVEALINIPANTEITSEMLALVEVPEEVVHPDALKDYGLIIGKVANSDIIAGEQILGGRLVAPGETTSNTLAYAIEPGMRAITLGVNETKGLAGMLKPQDFVDIIAEFVEKDGNGVDYSLTVMVVENIKVLAVDSVLSKSGKTSAADGGGALYSTVTLQVSPNDAMRLSLTEYEGSLRLVLRSPLDDKATNMPNITYYNIVTK